MRLESFPHGKFILLFCFFAVLHSDGEWQQYVPAELDHTGYRHLQRGLRADAAPLVDSQAFEDPDTVGNILEASEGAKQILDLHPDNRVAQLRLASVMELFGASMEAEKIRNNLSPVSYYGGTADEMLVRANALLRADPSTAVTILDSLVALSAVRADRTRLAPALLLRAKARLDLDRTMAAVADLDSSTAVVRSMRTQERPIGLVAAVGDLFYRLVMLHVNAGRTGKGLYYLERGRTAFLPAKLAHVISDPHRVPPNQLAIEYGLIGDTLLTWIVRGPDIQFMRKTVPRQQLVEKIASVRSSLDTAGHGNEYPLNLQRFYGTLFVPPQEHQAALYDWLIRPVIRHLAGTGNEIVLIVDGELRDLPFAALYDTASQRYLVEDHPLRFARSLHEAFNEGARVDVPKGVLLVSDPAFDATSTPGFSRLAGARAEVDTIAVGYADPKVLGGESAARVPLMAALREAATFHYAGHALYNHEHPHRSFLALASLDGLSDSGILTAAELEMFDLRHVQLVVLAACETSRARYSWSAGLPTLTDALLNAGAAGVVGSLSRVDDQHTRRLMIRFHRAYREYGRGATALRDAQLTFIRSNDPALRSPAAWATFQYMGR